MTVKVTPQTKQHTDKAQSLQDWLNLPNIARDTEQRFTRETMVKVAHECGLKLKLPEHA